jgi:hypothetical protein
VNRFTLLSLALGAALIDTGSALIYHPLGYIVAGAFLLTVGTISAKGKK